MKLRYTMKLNPDEIRESLKKQTKWPARIGKVSQAIEDAGYGQITPPMIHYYEEVGLIPKGEKTAPNQAYYDLETAVALVVIRKLRDIGMPTTQIKQVLDEELYLDPVERLERLAFDE